VGRKGRGGFDRQNPFVHSFFFFVFRKCFVSVPSV
jgi:hypothetical protein